MKISPDLSALGETKWYEYALRFPFGGAVTVGAGLIANKWCPHWYLRKTRGGLRGRRERYRPEDPIEIRQPESALRDDAIC